jgi:hypothetical protein
VPGVAHVEVAELEPRIRHVAELARPANQAVLERPNVTVRYGDGREMLLTTRNRYDVVLSEPSNPYRAGVAALYTEEFYRAVSERLNQGGIFGQWVQGYEIDTETVRVILKTLRSVIPRVTAWQTQQGDVLLVASQSPVVMDAGALRRRIAEEPFVSALPRVWLVSDLEGVLAHFLADEPDIERIAEAPGVEIATDDRNVLEHAFARALDAPSVDIPHLLLQGFLANGLGRPRVEGAVDWDRVAELRPRSWITFGGTPPVLPMPNAASRIRAEAVVAGCRGNVPTARAKLDGKELFENRGRVRGSTRCGAAALRRRQRSRMRGGTRAMAIAREQSTD